MSLRSIVLAGAASLSACAVAVDEGAIFMPNEAARRGSTEPMTLAREGDLPSGVRLTHERLDAPFGPLAITVADAPDQERLIVSCSGNAADRRRSGVGYLEHRLPFGDVLLFDLPGYGDSGGEATASQTEIAIDVLTEELRARRVTRALAWGQSLGGFVCAGLVEAAPELFAGAVMEVTASSTTAAANSFMPWYAKPFVRLEIADALAAYDNVEALSEFGGRIVVIGATEDESLPVALHRELAAGLKAADRDVVYLEFEGATHNHVGEHPDFERRVRAALP